MRVSTAVIAGAAMALSMQASSAVFPETENNLRPERRYMKGYSSTGNGSQPGFGERQRQRNLRKMQKATARVSK